MPVRKSSLEEEWVVVSCIEKMLLPASEREYATYDPSTGSWTGWTSPGRRSKSQKDSFPSLQAAMDVVRQVRHAYPHVTAVPLLRLVPCKVQ